MIVPDALDTQAQVWFEQFGGHSKGRGCRPLVFEDVPGAQSPLYPLPPFGAGGNMAFRREVLDEIGGFDVALGAGTPARGGEDSLAFTRVLLAGHRIAYRPGAMVRHGHYADVDGLASQLEGYGIGLTAYYTALVLEDPHLLLRLVRLISPALHDLRDPESVRNATVQRDFPEEVLRGQRRGMLRGPGAYLRSRLAQRRIGSSGVGDPQVIDLQGGR